MLWFVVAMVMAATAPRGFGAPGSNPFGPPYDWGPPPTPSLVANNIDYPNFLSRHDMLFEFAWNGTTRRWDFLPTSWITAPFLGNGFLGNVLYACDAPPQGVGRGGLCWAGNATRAAELRLEIGRQDLYSARRLGEGRFWDGIRLPVGYLRIAPAGQITGGHLRLRLHDATLTGRITTTHGTLSLNVLVHAKERAHVVEVGATGAEAAGLAFHWEPLTRCVDRWDVAGLPSCGLRPNPPQACTAAGAGEMVCHQRMDTADQGTFATAVKEVAGEGGQRRRVYLTTESAMWPYNTTHDPRPDALRAVRSFAARHEALLDTHRAWWARSCRPSAVLLLRPAAPHGRPRWRL